MPGHFDHAQNRFVPAHFVELQTAKFLFHLFADNLRGIAIVYIRLYATTERIKQPHPTGRTVKAYQFIKGEYFWVLLNQLFWFHFYPFIVFV